MDTRGPWRPWSHHTPYPSRCMPHPGPSSAMLGMRQVVLQKVWKPRHIHLAGSRAKIHFGHTTGSVSQQQQSKEHSKNSNRKQQQQKKQQQGTTAAKQGTQQNKAGQCELIRIPSLEDFAKELRRPSSGKSSRMTLKESFETY